MKEKFSDDPSATPDVSDKDNDILSLIKRMQQQMALLERKIDILIRQSQERQPREKSGSDRPFRNGSYAKPFRSFDQPRRHGKGEYGRGQRDKDPSQGRFYERRPHKKPSSFKRKDRE